MSVTQAGYRTVQVALSKRAPVGALREGLHKTKERLRRGTGSGTLTEIAFVWPILAGKEEEWRRALQELEGSRAADFRRMGRRLGIGAIHVWLQRTRQGEMAVVHLELDDPAEAISMLADSTDTFDTWLKSRVEELHEVEVARVRSNRRPELVFLTEPEKQKA